MTPPRLFAGPVVFILDRVCGRVACSNALSSTNSFTMKTQTHRSRTGLHFTLKFLPPSFGLGAAFGETKSVISLSATEPPDDGEAASIKLKGADGNWCSRGFRSRARLPPIRKLDGHGLGRGSHGAGHGTQDQQRHGGHGSRRHAVRRVLEVCRDTGKTNGPGGHFVGDGRHTRFFRLPRQESRDGIRDRGPACRKPRERYSWRGERRISWSRRAIHGLESISWTLRATRWGAGPSGCAGRRTRRRSGPSCRRRGR